MKLKTMLCFVALFCCALGVSSCSEESPTAPLALDIASTEKESPTIGDATAPACDSRDLDPIKVCKIGACLIRPELSETCVDWVTYCISNNLESQDFDQCLGAAILVCGRGKSRRSG